jgi:dienelactone hydrolase
MAPLESGDRLGRHEVLEPLGAGGMGEVYRARDSKLGREVALKVLPGEFVADPERLARFEREARAASALNHPNICTIYDVGEHDGRPYLVMELLEGQSLRERIDGGKLSPCEILDVGVDVADALDAAHAAGIVHRDIKPANIFLTGRGQAKVLDFGLARIGDTAEEGEIDLEAPTLHSPDLTRPGTAVGTVSYMSPEQVLGKAVDERTDIFSLGVVLYETATGSMPFSGRTSGAVFDQIVHSAPASPVKLNPELPRDLARIVNACLEKEPDRRLHADKLRDALDRLRHEISGERLEFRERLRRSVRRPVFWLATVSAVVLVAAVVVMWSGYASKVRRAREVVLPELRELSEDTRANVLRGTKLIREVEPLLGDDAEFQELKSLFTARISIRTEPQGAEVSYRAYVEPDAPWESLGTTPIESAVLPATYLRWKVERAGYETVLDVRHTHDWGSESGGVGPTDKLWRIDEVGTRPPDMIRVPGSDEIPPFLADRYEVTNRQFRRFVDAGGYDNPEYWRHDFIHGDRTLDRRSAMELLVDQTGRPGPSTWEAGDYPDGQDDHPVRGVSWYEAAAFAEFAGKSLPTIHHWDRASGIFVGLAQWSFTGLYYPMCNFGGDGPVAVGASHAMTPLGALDMAGNVREWCFNPAPNGRCLRGGAWNDPTYMFRNITQADPFDRSAKNGFRCVSYGEESAVPAELFEPLAGFEMRELLEESPVSDEVFAAYRALFHYDPLPLDARMESRHEDHDDWLREKVSYTTAYGDERITAQLFLPKNASPPYQAVLYFPGSGAVPAGPTDRVEQRGEFRRNVAFLVKTGRAVLYPAYRGTHERRYDMPQSLHWNLDPTHEFTTFQVHVVKDVQRSLDFLQSRPDIDPDLIAYSGFSWGGSMANLALAVDDRFKAAVLNVGGLPAHRTPRPEVDYLNYAPRVSVPVLMLNGRYDLAMLFEAEVQPMYQLLGTPEEHKRLIVYDTDHFIDHREVVKETLAWLDRYLGPVTPAH